MPDVEAHFPGFLANVAPYPVPTFRRDLWRVTEGRTDPEISEIMVGESHDTVFWMHDQGIQMEAAATLAGVKIAGEWKWSAGAIIRAAGEGIGLSRMWFAVSATPGIEVRYDTGARRLLQDAYGRVAGLEVKGPDGLTEIAAGAVVLGCGGVEANLAWRARYLNRPWDTAKVRGTPCNTGDGLRMALEIGALPHGQWSGSHGTPIDADAPEYGDR